MTQSAPDATAYRENIARLGGYGVAGLFAAGGTGEFFSGRAAGAGVEPA